MIPAVFGADRLYVCTLLFVCTFERTAVGDGVLL